MPWVPAYSDKVTMLAEVSWSDAAPVMSSIVLPWRGLNISQRSTRWQASFMANLRLVSTLRGGITSVTLFTLAAQHVREL